MERKELEEERVANIKARKNEQPSKLTARLAVTNGAATKTEETNGVHKTSDNVYSNQVALTDVLATKL